MQLRKEKEVLMAFSKLALLISAHGTYSLVSLPFTWSRVSGSCHHCQPLRAQVGTITATMMDRSSFVGPDVCVLGGEDRGKERLFKRKNMK